MAYKTLQLRRDTAANWVSNNPTLLAGEPGYEIDTGKLAIGDGTTAWNILQYVDSSIDHDVLANVHQDVNTDATPTLAGLIIANGGTIGQAAGPLLTFDDTNNCLTITGCKVGIGVIPTAGTSFGIKCATAQTGAIILRLRDGNDKTLFYISDYGDFRIYDSATTTNFYFSAGSSLPRIIFDNADSFLIGKSGDTAANMFTINRISATQYNVYTSGNIGVGTTTFGTNATKVLALGTGVAPASSPADAFQMYSADIVAGNAAPHFRTELGNTIKLYQQTFIASPAADVDELKTAVDAIRTLLTNNGLMAAA